MSAEPVHAVLTVDEAATAARISRRHFHTLLQQDQGPSVIRLGRRLVIRRTALNAWLLSREATHAAA